MQLRLVHDAPLVTPDHGKPKALALSLGLHVASFFALMEAPPLTLQVLPPPSPSEYQQAFAGKEEKIVWYKFRKLPDVRPRVSPDVHRPLRAEVKAQQAIISSPPNAPKRDQMVWTPAPEIAEVPPLELPNMIAVKLPPKEFNTPPDLVQPPVPEIKVPEATEAVASPPEMAKLPMERLPPKPFVPPQAPAKPAAPKIEMATDAPAYQPTSSLPSALPAVRLPSRPFVPPTLIPVHDTRVVAQPTEVAGLTASPLAPSAMPQSKLPARAFAPPPSNPGSQQQAAAIDAPAPPINANPGDLTVAIAGLNPAADAVKLPAARSPAQFSAGPKVVTDGVNADGAEKGLTAPDLFARAPGETKPDLMARLYAPPTSKEVLNEALRYGHPVIGTDPPPTSAPARIASPQAPQATRVSSSPDSRFDGRDVYMMAIQMPNLTSYSGSWLMWYADRTARQTGLQPIAAPVAHRKVDPKYLPTAVEEHIEGKVRLYCVIGREGTVSSVQLLHGIDERLDRSAEEALAKWEFYPATRNGQPVDVDVVVEIPFILAPRIPTRYK